MKYVIGYTWSDFVCTQTLGPLSVHLPCDRSDPLLCHQNKLYGIFSYGYDTDYTPDSIINPGSSESGRFECSDPTVQGRSLFVNNHVKWIADTISNIKMTPVTKNISKHKIDDDGSQRVTSTVTITQTPSTSSINQAEMIENLLPDPENYPYLVHFQGLPNEPICGGTLISPVHVLTTAYCTMRMTEIQVTIYL